jgi:hypothetical protein
MRRPDDLVWSVMLGILEAALVVGVVGASLRDLPVVRRLIRVKLTPPRSVGA